MRLFKESDYGTLREWSIGHGGRPLQKEELPKVGLIIEDVCAGFLYRTDSKVAFIDHIVSNPDAKAREVSKAVDIITNYLSAWAHGNGYNVCCFTRKGSIAKRAIKLGFKKNPERWVFLSLEGDT